MTYFTYKDYFKWLDNRANRWYKRLFVKIIKRYYPQLIVSEYRKWILKLSDLDLSE